VVLKDNLARQSRDLQGVKAVENLIQLGRKVVSKFELSETQFKRTVKDIIACKTPFE